MNLRRRSAVIVALTLFAGISRADTFFLPAVEPPPSSTNISLVTAGYTYDGAGTGTLDIHGTGTSLLTGFGTKVTKFDLTVQLNVLSASSVTVKNGAFTVFADLDSNTTFESRIFSGVQFKQFGWGTGITRRDDFEFLFVDFTDVSTPSTFNLLNGQDVGIKFLGTNISTNADPVWNSTAGFTITGTTNKVDVFPLASPVPSPVSVTGGLVLLGGIGVRRFNRRRPA